MLHLVYGRSQSARQNRIYALATELVKTGKPCFLFTPESATLQTEMAVFSRLPESANLNFEVLNFRRFPDRLHRSFGMIPQSTVSEGGKAILTALALRDSAPVLKAYGDLFSGTELAKQMAKEIEGLKAMGISPDTVADAAKNAAAAGTKRLSEKLFDLGTVYGAYESFLHRSALDGTDRLSAAAERAAEVNFFSDSYVILSGFSGFTVQEYAVIKAMLKGALELYVTVSCERDDQEDIFEKPLATARKLSRLAALQSVAIAPNEQVSSEKEGELLQVEKYLWRTDKVFEGEVSRVETVSCKGLVSQLRTAARLVLSQTKNGDMMRDVIIAAPDVSAVHAAAQSVFDRHGIPLYLSAKQELSKTPLYRFIRASLNAAIKGFPYGEMQTLIRSGYAPMPRAAADALSLYCATWKIGGAVWKSPHDFSYNPDGYTESLTGRAKNILKTVNEGKRLLSAPLCALSEKLELSQNAKDASLALYEYLRECRVKEQLEKEEKELRKMGKSRLADCQRQLFGAVLSCMEQCTELCTGTLSPAEYVNYLTLAMDGTKVGGIPGYIDQVQLLPANQLEGYEAKTVIILNANEGVFPKKQDTDVFFTRREMALLPEYGLDMLSEGQAYDCEGMREFYQAAALAKEKLFVLYDSEYPPSVGVNMLTRLLSKKPVSADSIPFVGAYGALEEYIRTKDSALSEICKADIISSSPLCLDGASVDKELAEKIYSASFTISPSRAETYRLCKLSYWGKYVLKLREEKEAKMESAEIGTYAHALLQHFMQDMLLAGRDPSTISDEELAEMVKSYVGQYANTVLGGLEDKSGRFKYLLARLEGNVLMFLKNMRDEYVQSEFLPWRAEYPIGRENTENSTKGLTVELGDGASVTVAGIADRVDFCERDGKTYIRVGDYKTGGKELSVNDVNRGLSLQMLLYLFSLCKNATDKFSGQLVPAGAMYYSVKRPDKNVGAKVTNETLDEETVKSAYGKSGIFLFDEEILSAMDKELSGRFIPVKRGKNGQIKADANLVSAEAMGELANKVEDCIRTIATELRCGKAQAEPYKEGDHDACKFCKLFPLCRVSDDIVFTF